MRISSQPWKGVRRSEPGYEVSMSLFDYLVPQPPHQLSRLQKAEFDALLLATPAGDWIDYRQAAPKWQFLSDICGSGNLAQVHGHDDARLSQLVSAEPDGFPWPEALVE